MKRDWSQLEQFRVQPPRLPKTQRGDRQGVFKIAKSDLVDLIVIAHDGAWSQELDPWEHVSVRAHDVFLQGKERIPTWEEMCFIKEAFWEPEECVMQLHPPKSNYVNIRSTVLHLWRPVGREIPAPPREAV